MREQCEEFGRDNGSTGWWGGVYLRLGFTLREWRGLRAWAKELVLTNEDPSRNLRAEINNGKPTVLTQPVVDEIRERFATSGSLVDDHRTRTRQEMADDFGISVNTLKGVVYNKTWTKPRQVLRGEKAPGAKLTNDDVLEIKRCLAAGESQKVLAERFGVHNSIISNIKTGKKWASVGEVTPVDERQCKQCGKGFERKGRAVFCSFQCQQKNYYEAHYSAEARRAATATVVTLSHDEWPPKDPQPDTLYLRMAP